MNQSKVERHQEGDDKCDELNRHLAHLFCDLVGDHKGDDAKHGDDNQRVFRKPPEVVRSCGTGGGGA